MGNLVAVWHSTCMLLFRETPFAPSWLAVSRRAWRRVHEVGDSAESKCAKFAGRCHLVITVGPRGSSTFLNRIEPCKAIPWVFLNVSRSDSTFGVRTDRCLPRGNLGTPKRRTSPRCSCRSSCAVSCWENRRTRWRGPSRSLRK